MENLNWRAWIKAIVTTGLLVPPAIADVVFNDQSLAGYMLPAFMAYSFVVFIGALVYFGPDVRFEAVRDAAMDRQFDDLFADARESLGPSERLPYRVYIFQPRFLWSRLNTIYMYNGQQSDPDYWQSFWSWHGLCGKVYHSGLMGWFDKREHNTADFRLTEAESRGTCRVWASCCVPLRNATGGPDGGSSAVKAVISFDCLTEEGIDGLRQFHDKLAANDQDFLDELTIISLYFT